MRRSLAPSKREHSNTASAHSVSNPTSSASLHVPALPAKRRRLFTSPLLPKNVSTATENHARHQEDNGGDLDALNKVEPGSCYSVVYRKKQQKKHKTWDADGILVVHTRSALLQNMEGKVYDRAVKKDLSRHLLESAIRLGKCGLPSAPLAEGSMITIGNREVEVGSLLAWSDYTSGQCYIESQGEPVLNPTKGFKKFKALSGNIACSSTVAKIASPRHNPYASNALVMPRPVTEDGGQVKECPRYKLSLASWVTYRRTAQIIDVVVDPVISSHLRPHQREGVVFLYECVMQMRDFNGAGAILADEMGLGKTVQTIAVIWTLLKQTSIAGSPPPVKRALIVCPATLVENWKNEFRKWLGDERIRVFAVDEKSQIADFIVSRLYQVLVIGYEKMRALQDEIAKANFDIAVYDEGHRLKNSQIRTAQVMKQLQTSRRILLSGTPMQNDLSEFFSIIDFVNPGVLGTFNTFKKVFQDPIMKSRDRSCTPEEYDLGQKRSKELSRLTHMFILRRTSEVNARYLPPKSEFVLFCRPTALQLSMYRHILGSPDVKTCIHDAGKDMSNILEFSTMLKKLLNAPQLVTNERVADFPILAPEVLNDVRQDAQFSGKMSVLASLLRSIRETTQEKVLIVSNWTQTLDLIETLCTQRAYGLLRLDGKTPVAKRQKYVDQFNTSNAYFVFLLSSKAGGVGLNLTGASRLILYDIDWNPSICQQAMARIWRDGQSRDVKIYRLLSTGTIEEKIYQRQLTKISLSDALIDDKETGMNAFTSQELKDLFTLDENTECLTHDLLGCSCQKGMISSTTTTFTEKFSELKCWEHLSSGMVERLQEVDPVITRALSQEPALRKPLSYIFHKATVRGGSLTST
ncbi:uncharacterized protein SPPG_07408 [Spizellomyces punctatus DAOM BR117]|uniref:DNA repair and recombination protein RAD54B n=1 Tax=Spizellomyces punctatus (strain DAOM BR117) TaxID=645134 RepID=A0A0L0HA03_SPIPD|nr:uncharacterized protein SPPG_07408 [Spizellomyces punctatus DAOM BR117]KNC97493.1 hypothetical protein SPPG_07408 [Spizellomyces punctatus DAOM BR117]|eukprot:XP_016605533.1 hypothetical protein SPPG_07408 [Spizellomyces punctatus DAOM BR117]